MIRPPTDEATIDALPPDATHSVALENVAADKAAVDRALRALWPRLKQDQHGPLRTALAGLLDSLASLEHMKIAIEGELSA